ncbi:MAG: hypothetical protein QGI05_03980 [Candidatus Omnitrophota bacterium]|nr:hypothetical protein [Candidatus Omnitrophota bacterium]
MLVGVLIIDTSAHGIDLSERPIQNPTLRVPLSVDQQRFVSIYRELRRIEERNERKRVAAQKFDETFEREDGLMLRIQKHARIIMGPFILAAMILYMGGESVSLEGVTTRPSGRPSEVFTTVSVIAAIVLFSFVKGPYLFQAPLDLIVKYYELLPNTKSVFRPLKRSCQQLS